MTYDFFMSQIRTALIAMLAYASGKGWLTPADSGAITGLAAGLGPIFLPWLWSIYTNFNAKIVPHDAVVAKPPMVAPIPRQVLALVTSLPMLALIASSAFAADNLPAPIKSPAVAPAPCVPQNCSGWFAGFGLLGDGTNADIIGSGISNSLFQAGGAIMAKGGYQLWNNAWFAAIELGAGYQFNSTSASALTQHGSKFTGEEIVKLGYNFFPNASLALTTPSQSPVPIAAPANLLANMTPCLAFGGLQRRGISEWVSGACVQAVIASGWTSDVTYLYAPSQAGVPATNIVELTLKKHF